MILKDFKKCLEEINEEKLKFLKHIIEKKNNIIILGNGGSNAISSHISQDYTKALGKKCLSFADASRLTCYINDYGMDNAYMKFIEHFKTDNMLVILISSSGNSTNILNSAKFCFENKIDMITLSGFNITNKLKEIYSEKSLISFWVNSKDYGIVEILHELILHSVI